MTLTEFRYALALAKTCHFGKAAKICHVTQPTLSVAISKLENTLGISLFERDRHEVRLTEQGKSIITKIQVILEQVSQLKNVAQEMGSQIEERLAVGAIYTVGPYLFPRLVPALQKIAPQMPLLLQEGYSSELKERLLQGHLDAVIISLPFSHLGLVCKPLYEEALRVVIPRTHPLNQKTAVLATDLAQETILLLDQQHCFRQQVLDACPGCDNNNNALPAFEGTSLETLRHMVASGAGITILPESALHSPFYTDILSNKPFAEKEPKRTIALAWRTSFPRPKAIAALISALHSDYQNM